MKLRALLLLLPLTAAVQAQQPTQPPRRPLTRGVAPIAA